MASRERLGDLLDLARARRGCSGSAPAARPAPASTSRPCTTDIVAQAAELERQQRERDHLARERLGGRDADLRTGVQVDAAVVLARDRRAHHVHEAERLRAAALRLAHGRQRVGRFARLRDDDAQRLVGDDRVAVAELRRVLHLAADARMLLDHHLADQRAVPARAARRDDDVVEALAALRRSGSGRRAWRSRPRPRERPRIVFSMVCGCSMISLSMKWS